MTLKQWLSQLGTFLSLSLQCADLESKKRALQEDVAFYGDVVMGLRELANQQREKNLRGPR